ncbi:hypothetical protein PAEVO_32760 [Paenibacillus sp. GM2FR]|uniref:DUF309 domain-containing protein n=1 Tax=Paenibacillus sp. GM2FR TaxID=2059268 RepID=UPI000C27D5BD|nr:DUF309 domain-containing protein [Paenibacillus sp. GM2FR]PJN56552.1 hypothetical protein PAEVO_32760 [Paenibacillus sp. GM2FR]
MSYEPLYVAYLVYFNRDQDYFECHEVLEELWLARERDPRYKGLLQVAVGLFHFRNNNVRGAYKMFTSAVSRLEGYPGDELGISMGKLVSEVRESAKQLSSYSVHPFPYRDLTIEIGDTELKQAVQLASERIQPNIPQRRKPERAHSK